MNQVPKFLKKVESKMVDKNDLFESLLFLEEKSFQDGYREGYDTGKRKGIRKGWELGVEKGGEIGTEIGYYSGFAATWIQLIRKNDSTKPRVLKTLESLQSMISHFPFVNPLHENFLEDLNKIRAKFKQVCSLLGVQAEYEAITEAAKVEMSF